MTGRALVTGATGMLGSHIVDVLLERGWWVRALVRDRRRAETLSAAGIELAEGRLEDAASLGAAATGMDAVFHAAATIGSDGDWARYRDVNVVGTCNLVEAVAVAGARLVHVSSTSVHGAARYHDEPTTEETELPELPRWDFYGRSKQAAEGLVLQASRSGRIWGAVVRPPLMYGRRDRQLAPRIGPLLERGFFPRIAGGRTTMTLVNVRHVAEGAVLAATRESAEGRVYLLAEDFPVTVTDLVRGAEAGLGRRILAPEVPGMVGHVAFAVLAAGLRASGRASLARHAPGTLAMLTRDNPFSSARARQELGWSPSVPPSVGIADAFRDWRRARNGCAASRPDAADAAVEAHR